MIKQQFTLKDIARITGIQANRLRVWKNRYGLMEPVAKMGKRHLYSPSTLRYIMQIARLLEEGHRISDILEMEESEREDRLQALVQQHEGSFRDQVRQELLHSVLELDHSRLREAYYSALERFGFKATFRDLLFPLLSYVGTLWELETIHSVHEHLFSHFIRQKLIVGIDHAGPAGDEPEVTLFLPDQELHDIPLLFLQYLLLEEQMNSVYLGSSVPYNDIEDYLSVRLPDTAACYITYTGNIDYHKEKLPSMVAGLPAIDFHLAVPTEYSDDFRKQLKEMDNPPGNLSVYDDLESLAQAVTERAD